ncbi:MAG: glycosyltransferase family 1 protein [Sphingobacteriales bacterium]|nr:MAG: glycosyltransferase family 1 protein [Sphingobacteriales bacterium]
MQKLFRITTVSLSLDKLLHGQLGFMSKYYNVVGISSADDRLNYVGGREGVKTIGLEMTRKITPAQDLKATWQLYKLLKKEKPLIVHTHTPKAGIVGMLAAKMAGVPHRLHTVAGLPLLVATGNKRKVLNFVEKFTYSLATKVYPNSFGLKQIIQQEGFCKDDKLKVIGQGSSNGIDTTYFSPGAVSNEQKEHLKSELSITDDNFVFLNVGRLVGDKGINELVQAFVALHKLHPQAKLLLVGPFESDLDPLQADTEKTIHDHPAIIETGFQPDVRPYLAIADALAFPSYREGFPNVVMQAGAMGLPSIVTNINGCNEIVVEGKNGIIIPVKDAQALQLSMSNFITDRSSFAAMQQQARPMICDRYEQHVVWNELLKEYRSLEAASA